MPVRFVDVLSNDSYSVRSWFAEQEGIENYKEMFVKAETSNAYLMQFSEKEQRWIPKSLCSVQKHKEDVRGVE